MIKDIITAFATTPKSALGDTIGLISIFVVLGRGTTFAGHGLTPPPSANKQRNRVALVRFSPVSPAVHFEQADVRVPLAAIP